MNPRPKASGPLPLVGWREWVALPELGIDALEAKIDTGAMSCAIHATEIEVFDDAGLAQVRFRLDLDGQPRRSSAPLLELRGIRSSNGQREDRPVIATTLELLGQRVPIELTLTRRDAMGVPMLVGRRALAGRFYVDPARAYLGGAAKG